MAYSPLCCASNLILGQIKRDIERFKKTLLTAVLFFLLCALCVAGAAWVSLHVILMLKSG